MAAHDTHHDAVPQMCEPFGCVDLWRRGRGDACHCSGLPADIGFILLHTCVPGNRIFRVRVILHNKKIQRETVENRNIQNMFCAKYACEIAV